MSSSNSSLMFPQAFICILEIFHTRPYINIDSLYFTSILTLSPCWLVRFPLPFSLRLRSYNSLVVSSLQQACRPAIKERYHILQAKPLTAADEEPPPWSAILALFISWLFVGNSCFHCYLLLPLQIISSSSFSSIHNIVDFFAVTRQYIDIQLGRNKGYW
jgi:hypothetical protein